MLLTSQTKRSALLLAALAVPLVHCAPPLRLAGETPTSSSKALPPLWGEELRAGAETGEIPLADGGEQRHRIVLLAPRTFEVEVSSDRLQLDLEITTVAGERVARGTLWATGEGSRILCVAAPTAQEYNLMVRHRNLGVGDGTYQVAVVGGGEGQAPNPTQCRAVQALAEGQAQLYDDVDLDGAHVTLGRGLEAAAALGDPYLEAWFHHEIGYAHSTAGDLAAALPAHRRAERLLRSAAGSGPEHVLHQLLLIDVLNSLANSQLERPRALELHEEALAIARDLNDRSREARTLANLGLAYAQREDPQRGLALYRTALELWRDVGEVPMQANTLHNTAEVYLSLGDFQKTLEYCEQALPLHRQVDDWAGEAHTLDHLAEAYSGMGDHARALELLDESQAIGRRHGLKWSQARAQQRIASVHAALGRSASALDGFRSCSASWNELGNILGRAACLTGEGAVVAELGRPELAAELHREALDVVGEQGTQVVIQALSGLALLDARNGARDQAIEKMSAVLDLIEAARSKVRDEDLRARYFATQRHYYDFAVRLHAGSYAPDPDRAALARAFELSERSRARSLAELLARSGVLREIADAELQQRVLDNRSSFSALRRRLVLAQLEEATATPEVEAEEQRLQELEQEWHWLRQEMREAQPRLVDLRPSDVAGLEDAQRLLRPDQALLAYHLANQESLLFVITPKSAQRLQLPARESLERKVAAMRDALATPGRRKQGQYDHSARELYRALIEPAHQWISSASELVILPDGVLNELPFEALLSSPQTGDADSHRQYLVQRWAVRQAPSATVLALLQREASPAAFEVELVAYGHPSYEGMSLDRLDSRSGDSNTPTQALARLPQSGAEITALAQLFEPEARRIFVGADANEAAVKENDEIGQARYVHFATHARVDRQRPAETGLVLSSRGDSAEDGLLLVEEVFDLELRAALVVLSSCDSGLGARLGGEGFLGLTRAFLQAGASGLIVSLWQIEDQAAADFMVELYRGLRRHGNASRALRDAKLALINGGVHSHPYYWAPFVLVGSVDSKDVNLRRFGTDRPEFQTVASRSQETIGQ